MNGLINVTLLFCLLIIGACYPPDQPPLLQENSTTRLVEVAPTRSPEELALLNKIANRTLLQEVIDHAPKEQVETTSFGCSAQSGGVVTFIHKAQKLRGVRLSLSQQQMGRSTRWYYQNNQETVLIAHEQSEWHGDQESIHQTVFYVDGGELIQVLHRAIEAIPSRLETILEQTPFENVLPQSQEELWLQLQIEEQMVLPNQESANYTAYFCS
ncbi:MAG: hypothetical protein AB8E82_01880 [Aureispira sp.]